MARIALPLVALLGFTAYTFFVAANQSIFGYLAALEKGSWSLQILLDLACAATCFWVVAVPRARARRMNPWPYVAATPFLGSIAILAYFVHRSLRERRRHATTFAEPSATA